MPSRQPCLSVRDLRLGYQTPDGLRVAVEGVSFDLYAGETFALLGESGCGKSATALGLLKLLPAAGRVLGGQVWLGEQDVLACSDAERRQIRGGRIAMIFQEPTTSLNPVLTVGAQIGEVLAEHRGLTGEAARTVTLDLLEQVGIGDGARRIDEYPFQFSGGMKQRVMIAMSLAGEPDVLIADEPTTALDVTVQAQILDLLAKLQAERGMALLLISHDLGVLSQMADRVGVMYAGELVEVAPRDAFFSRPAHPYSRALFAAIPEAVERGQPLQALPGQVPRLGQMPIGCRFVDRCASAMDQCRQQSPSWQSLSDGHHVRCWLPQMSDGLPEQHALTPTTELAGTLGVGASTVLVAEDVRVHFPIRRGFLKRVVGQVKAVDGVSLSLAAGQTLAVVGESGCGKTTLGKALLQLQAVTAGRVTVAGQDWTGLSHRQLRPLRRNMQMVFQDPFGSLNPRQRIEEILFEGLQAQGLMTSLQTARPALAKLLGQVGLDESALSRFPHEFSGGQRQRIAIARALAVQPKVLICDEPTSALDVSVQAQILNLLKDLQQELGLAYLFITHNFAVVRYLADEVAVMYQGKIVEQGPAEQIFSSPQHPYTQTLLAAVPTIQRGA